MTPRRRQPLDRQVLGVVKRPSVCSCHSDNSLYGSLANCPACGHRSLDPGIGCERRACGYEVPAGESS